MFLWSKSSDGFALTSWMTLRGIRQKSALEEAKAISQAQTLINNSYWWLSWKRNLPAVQETVFNPWVRKISWRRALATHSIILAWENPIDTGAWWATVPGAAESDTTKQ